MRRRALLQSLLAMPLAAVAGCAEFGPGYAVGDMPRAAPVRWPGSRRRTALVLGSGGPRGFAHVGVLKALEAAGVEPDLIVGSSAGAIVGALYAARLPARDIEQRALDVGVMQLADPALLRPNRFIGRALQNYVNEATGARTIEQLPRLFCAVAAPLGKSSLVAFTAGDTGAAVRASAALPSMFLPTRIGDIDYEDGDMVSPVPIRVARNLGAERVVAIDVSAFLEDTPDRAPESWRARDAERRTMIDAEARDADLLLRIRLPYYAGMSREYRENLIQLAFTQTREALAKIAVLLS